jgi:inhibitor of KinA
MVRLLSESVVEIVLGDQISPDVHERVLALAAMLRQAEWPGVLEITTAYTSIALFFDPKAVRVAEHQTASAAFPPALFMLNRVKEQVLQFETSPLPAADPVAPETIFIPVRYKGPDLSGTADLLQMSEQELIRQHTATTYRVYMIGFLPGFPYLGILPESIRAPRLETPRLRVPAGSVAIAGAQTGIYPREAPGGWRLIGQTKFPLFDIHAHPPARLQPGMHVKFVET